MAHAGRAADEAEPAGPAELTLARRLKAAPDKVFAAWTNPTLLVRWFGPAAAPQDRVRADMDVRVGGRYRIRFDGADGQPRQVGGVYREIDPPRRLVFSWAWDTTPERQSLVTVTLMPDGRRHAADVAPPAVRRRGGTRPPSQRLDRHARQARPVVCVRTSKGASHEALLR